jgi:hypothetical protein
MESGQVLLRNSECSELILYLLYFVFFRNVFCIFYVDAHAVKELYEQCNINIKSVTINKIFYLPDTQVEFTSGLVVTCTPTVIIFK